MSCDNAVTKIDFCFKAKETWSVVLTCTDAQKNVIDLTGITSARWRICSTTNGVATAVALDASLGSGVAVKDATGGVLEIAVTAALQSTHCPPGAYVHELQIVNAAGGVSTQMEGALTVYSSLFDMFP